MRLWIRPTMKHLSITDFVLSHSIQRIFSPLSTEKFLNNPGSGFHMESDTSLFCSTHIVPIWSSLQLEHALPAGMFGLQIPRHQNMLLALLFNALSTCNQKIWTNLKVNWLRYHELSWFCTYSIDSLFPDISIFQSILTWFQTKWLWPNLYQI